MRNIREKNKINIKLLFAVFWLLFFGVLFFLSFWNKRDKDLNLDHKFGIIATDGVALVSISDDRKMINELSLNEEVSKEFKNILGQERNLEVIKSVFWYSFGFFPDKVLFLDSIGQWKNTSILIKNLGFLNWLKYEKNYQKMFLKQEKVNGKISENELFLDEVLVRDFSESKLNNEELRLSVFNNTNESGLAGFMTKRLEWSGFSVVSNDNDSQKIDNCLIIYGNKTDLNYGWKIINKILNCEKRKDETLNENELEIYFGDKFASMVKYSSYFK